jgi:broad specificity phosphatase PhoE
MHLFFVRHGQAVSNASGILAGQQEYDLTAHGHDQAQQAARFLQQYIGHIDVLYSSPQTRTIQTAQPFAQLFDLPIMTDDALKEQDWGIFAGKTYEELKHTPGFEHPKHGNWQWQPAMGESYATVHARVQPFLQHLVDSLPAHSHVVCVTHGGTMRIIRGIIQSTVPHYTYPVPGNTEIWHCQVMQQRFDPDIRSIYTAMATISQE